MAKDYFVNKGDTTLVPHALKGGAKTVTSAGTAEALSATDLQILSVVIKAKAGNTGTIYVGDSAVSSSAGFALAASESVSVEIDNLAKVFIDAGTSNDGVTFLYVTTK